MLANKLPHSEFAFSLPRDRAPARHGTGRGPAGSAARQALRGRRRLPRSSTSRASASCSKPRRSWRDVRRLQMQRGDASISGRGTAAGRSWLAAAVRSSSCTLARLHNGYTLCVTRGAPHGTRQRCWIRIRTGAGRCPLDGEFDDALVEVQKEAQRARVRASPAGCHSVCFEIPDSAGNGRLVLRRSGPISPLL